MFSIVFNVSKQREESPKDAERKVGALEERGLDLEGEGMRGKGSGQGKGRSIHVERLHEAISEPSGKLLPKPSSAEVLQVPKGKNEVLEAMTRARNA